MKIVKLNGFDTIQIFNMQDGLSVKEIIEKIGESSDLSSLPDVILNISSKIDCLFCKECNLTDEELQGLNGSEVTAISIPDPNEVLLRKLYIYQGISNNEIIEGIYDFMQQENLTGNNRTWKYVSKLRNGGTNLPTGQLELVYKSLESIGVKITMSMDIVLTDI